MNEHEFDVVTLGETMLRLTPEAFLRLEQADSLQIHVGGSESNTAVGLARLGKRVAWVSRLTDNFLGHRIEGAIAAQGVDTRYVVRTNGDRVGLYFLEAGSPPRTSHVIYDRANSAYSRFTADDLPAELFVVGRSKWLHVTGISLWLTDTSRAMIDRAVGLARSAGWQISFDVNHRTLLCSAYDARGYCEDIFRSADLAFLPRRDAVHLWSMEQQASDQVIMEQLLTLRDGKPTVMTLGDRGAMAADASRTFVQGVERVEPIGRLGGGDAFSAGFLSSWLDGLDLQRSLSWAIATARLKYSIPGDLPIIHLAEVERLVAGAADQSLVR
ncbi:MAG: sugar kinase [Pirellula sp.]